MPDSTAPNGHDRAVNRAAINKANAQHSTGPRTVAGKQRSSLNAWRHGLTGQTVVLPTEDQSAYQRHSQSLLERISSPRRQRSSSSPSLSSILPGGLNRAVALETNLFSLGLTELENRIRASHPEAEAALAMALAFREHMRAFANISTQSQRLARQFERTLALLRQIQAERRATEERQLDKAAKILKMHKDQNLPYEPAEDGFVFSSSQIETFLRRQDRSDQANNHAFYADASGAGL